MQVAEEYELSQYQDLGVLDEKRRFRLKRHKIYGYICVEKRVSVELEPIYMFLKSVRCPNIPRVYECIKEKEELILIEEYVPGRNLEEILHERKIYELEAIRIVLEICNALKVLHNANPVIVCRDLKAENVMVDIDGNVKLVDFNIARTVDEGKKRDTALLGTAEYAAPEQYGYFQTDNRTDIYALGVLFNYMVLGKFPVEQMAFGRAGEIITQCTQIDPNARYQNVEELESHLRTLYIDVSSRKTDKGVEKFSMAQNAIAQQGKEENHKKSWMIPGFRTKKSWKILLAILGYLMLTSLCFSLETKPTEDGPVPKVVEVAEQTFIWLTHIVFIFLVCNYRGWRDSIPLVRHKNIGIRIIGYFLLYFILICVACIATLTFQSLVY